MSKVMFRINVNGVKGSLIFGEEYKVVDESEEDYIELINNNGEREKIRRHYGFIIRY